MYCGSSLLRKGKQRRSPPSIVFNNIDDPFLFLPLRPYHPHPPKRGDLNYHPNAPPFSLMIDYPAGNYRDHIKRTLKAAKQPTDERHIQNSKFDCVSDGDIVFRQFCARGCGGTDSTNPDYCL